MNPTDTFRTIRTNRAGLAAAAQRDGHDEMLEAVATALMCLPMSLYDRETNDALDAVRDALRAAIAATTKGTT